MEPRTPRPKTVRERVRAEVLSDIVAAGNRQLAEVGAAALSVRAIARELGMVSSGIYRYVATRDELLTLLITAAFDDLGSAVEAGQQRVERDDLAGRFRRACGDVRTWALARPNEYALVFGTPVPGYRAPESTDSSAVRVPAVLGAILRDAAARRRRRAPELAVADAAGAVAPAVAFIGGDLPPAVVVRGLMVWSALFGAVSFELFGHFEGSVADDRSAHDAYFAECVARWEVDLQLA